MAVENSRRGCDVVEHRSVEAALASVKVALFERHGGSALPCMWLCGSGICKSRENDQINNSGILYFTSLASLQTDLL